MNSSEFNQLLRELQDEWKKTILLPYAEKHPEAISNPFYYRVSNEYFNANKRIMIIGQETNKFGVYTDNWNSQPWCVDYLRFQLWKIPSDSGEKYNASPFWRMFREFNNRGIVPSWNNVDKIQQYRKGENSPLSLELESFFSQRYGNDDKSLLQREIELDKPDILLFITGPYYCFTMATALGLKEEVLKSYRPSSQKYCVEITDLLNVGAKAFWTYHPRYLNQIHELLPCVDEISENFL